MKLFGKFSVTNQSLAKDRKSLSESTMNLGIGWPGRVDSMFLLQNGSHDSQNEWQRIVGWVTDSATLLDEI